MPRASLQPQALVGAVGSKSLQETAGRQKGCIRSDPTAILRLPCSPRPVCTHCRHWGAGQNLAYVAAKTPPSFSLPIQKCYLPLCQMLGKKIILTACSPPAFGK